MNTSNQHYIAARDNFAQYLNQPQNNNLIKAALEELKAAMVEIPEFPGLWHLAGLIYLQEGQPHIARKHWEYCIKLDPDYAAAYGYLGELYSENGESAAAIKSYESYLSCPQHPEDPSPALVNFKLGVAYLELENFEKAVHYSGEAVKLAPQFYQAYFNLGKALLSLKRFEEAATAYEESARIDPGYFKAQAELAIAYAELGRFQDARDHALRACALNMSDAANLYNLGRFHRELNDFAAALSVFQKVVDIDPTSAHRIARFLVRKSEVKLSPEMLKALVTPLLSVDLAPLKNIDLTGHTNKEDLSNFDAFLSSVRSAENALNGLEAPEEPNKCWEYPLYVASNASVYCEAVAKRFAKEEFVFVKAAQALSVRLKKIIGELCHA